MRQVNIRSVAMQLATKVKVTNFYLQDDVNRVMPNKKDVLKIKDDKRVKPPIAKRFMYIVYDTARSLFQVYKRKPGCYYR